MGVTEAVGLVLLVVATGCSAVLVAAETSIVHIGRARAEVIGDGLGDDDRVEALLALLDRRSEALRPLVLALVLCRTTTVALVVSWAYQRLRVLSHFAGRTRSPSAPSGWSVGSPL